MDGKGAVPVAVGAERKKCADCELVSWLFALTNGLCSLPYRKEDYLCKKESSKGSVSLLQCVF